MAQGVDGALELEAVSPTGLLESGVFADLASPDGVSGLSDLSDLSVLSDFSELSTTFSGDSDVSGLRESLIYQPDPLNTIPTG